MKDVWQPDDRFYEPYSLAVDFNYGPRGEYLAIKDILEANGYEGSDETIKQSMESIRVISREINRVGSTQILALKEQIKKEKIVAGIIPPDIFLSHEFWGLVLKAATLGVSIYSLIRARKKDDNVTKIVKTTTRKVLEDKDAKKKVTTEITKISTWKRKRKDTNKRKATKKKIKVKHLLTSMHRV